MASREQSRVDIFSLVPGAAWPEMTFLRPPLEISRHRQIELAIRPGEIDSSPMIPAFVLVVLAVVYRLATGLLIHSGTTWLSEFAPGSAIALCCAVYFPMKYKFSVPLGAL